MKKSAQHKFGRKIPELSALDVVWMTPDYYKLTIFFGKTNSHDTSPLCLNCHFLITLNQNKSSPSARSSSATKEQKLGILLVSVGSLLELIGKNLKNNGYGLISDE